MSNERERHSAPGLTIPFLGFGTYLIPDGEAAAAVDAAIRAGYRHIDTAEFYQNEAGVGEGIRGRRSARGFRAATSS